MRILIVSQYYTPDITAAAFRIAETAELLTQWGHEVAVITSEPHRAQVSSGEQPTAAGDHGPRGSDATAAENPKLHRVPVEPLAGSGLRPYLRHYFSFVLRARRAGKRLINDGFVPDVVWVSSPPLFVGLAGPALRRWARRAAPSSSAAGTGSRGGA